jgi:hypothetical protein
MRSNLTLISMAFLTVCTWLLAEAQQVDESQPTVGSLRWTAEQAKAKGLTNVIVNRRINYIGSAERLEGALDYYAVLTAKPVSSFVKASESEITTWYKFKVIGLHSRASKCPEPCAPLPPPPTELLPLRRDEIAISVPGGTATIDGVEITENTGMPKFEEGQKYLLFLRTGVAGSQVAMIGPGPGGIYQVDTQGTISPATKGRYSLVDDVTAEHDMASLQSRIQAHTASRSASPSPQ